MSDALHLALTAVSLGGCLALLWFYIRGRLPGSRQLEVSSLPEARLAWFRRKAGEQAVVMLAAPMAALAITSHLALAFAPGAVVAPFAYEVWMKAGLTGDDFTFSFGWQSLLMLAAVILVLEAVPVLRGKGRSFMLGKVGALLPRNLREAQWTALLSLGAGVGEELLFRALIPLSLATLGVPIVWAFLISCAIFAACHTYQGWVGVLATGFLGLVLSAAYATTYSLVTAMVLHVLIDIVGLVVRPLVGLGLQRIAGRVRAR